MKILNFGSVNIDRVFKVQEIVRPGQTISSQGMQLFPGGKGFNQTLALAKAGADVYHAGMIGNDGLWLKEMLEKAGADCSYLFTTDTDTGSAFIQIDARDRTVSFSMPVQIIKTEPILRTRCLRVFRQVTFSFCKMR